MGHPLLAQLQQNAVFRAGFVAVAMLGVVGIGWAALSTGCFTGACKTAAPDAALLLTAPERDTAPPTPQLAAPPTKKVEIAEAKVPTISQNDVVNQTFATLKVDLKLPTKTTRAAQLGASPSADPASGGGESEGGLRTRTVKTISVNPDGTPVTAAPLQVAAASKRSAVQSPEDDRVSLVAYASTAGAALDGLPVVAAIDKVASAPVPAKPPAAKARVDTAVVSMSVNVRSGPSKGKSKVMFTLAAGETVTVRDKQRGWVKVTDDKGRTGWIYQDFLKG